MPDQQRRLWGARLPTKRRAMGRSDASHHQKHGPQRRRADRLRQIQLAQAHGGNADFDVQQWLDLPTADVPQQSGRDLLRFARRHGLRLLRHAQWKLQDQRERVAELIPETTMAVAARRIHMGMAAGELFLAASLAGIPTAGADPTVTLPA